MRLPESAPVPI